MHTPENKALVREYFAELWNHKRVELLSRYVAADCQVHFPAGQERRIRDVQEWMQSTFAVFGDAHFQVEALIGDEELVACRWRFTGTNTGDVLGTKATYRQVEYPGMSWFRLASGKIVEIWANQDSFGLLQQLGITPVPGQ
jgi:steroid delta-isomerase-like uncharacterized protein